MYVQHPTKLNKAVGMPACQTICYCFTSCVISPMGSRQVNGHSEETDVWLTSGKKVLKRWVQCHSPVKWPRTSFMGPNNIMTHVCYKICFTWGICTARGSAWQVNIPSSVLSRSPSAPHGLSLQLLLFFFHHSVAPPQLHLSQPPMETGFGYS